MITGETFLLWSASGKGKTTLISRTLPGRTLVIETDAGGASSLANRIPGVTVFEVPPDRMVMNEEPRGLKNTRPDTAKVAFPEPLAYSKLKRFLYDLTEEKRVGEKPHWSDFDNICLDTISGVTDMVTARILWMKNQTTMVVRGGDWGPIGTPVRAVINTLLRAASYGPNVIICGHEYLEKPDSEFAFDDDSRSKPKNPFKEYCLRVSAIGGARQDIPKQVGHGFRLVTFGSGSTLQYRLQTRPSRPDIEGVKTAWHWLPPEIDVTIKEWDHPEQYGFGLILAEAERRRGGAK